MHRRWLLLGCAGVALLGACGAGDEVLSSACTDRAQVERALAQRAGRGDARRRHEPVVLPAGRHDARAPAGPRLTFTAVAENLETQANGDPAAARQLGYLIGAARRGIEGSSGTSAELTHRLERTRRGGRRPGVRRRARRGPARGGAIGMTPLRLRLFHAADGTRVAYREAGVGPGLVLLHSAGLSHREFEPVVEHLTHRFRLILPDLPLHGDSEDRPRHPVHAGLVRRGHGRVLRRHRRAPAARRRARRRCPGAPARRRERPSAPRAARHHADAAAPPPAAPGPPRPRARRRPRGLAARARPRDRPRRQDGRPPGARHEAHGPQQPRRARSRPPRDGRRRRQSEPRALVGARRARVAGRRAAHGARPARRAWTCPSCCCGPTRTRRTR